MNIKETESTKLNDELNVKRQEIESLLSQISNDNKLNEEEKNKNQAHIKKMDELFDSKLKEKEEEISAIRQEKEEIASELDSVNVC